MLKARYEYKLLLKQKNCHAQSCFSNELHDALIDKDYATFCRSWEAKFGRTVNSQVINGHSDHAW